MSQRLQLLLNLFLIFISTYSHTQNISNGILSGVVALESAPSNWSNIPFTDPASQALGVNQATVDVLDSNGPSAGGGIAGNPHAGSSFCSGLHAEDPGGTLLWHEGIMQDVNGFITGTEYTLSFFQSVVKQNNCLDKSGSWRVYIDNILLTTTAPTVSNLLATNINLDWEKRTVNFTATANTHTLKFIPWDDDANIVTSTTDSTGGLRMGIDSIHLEVTPVVPPFIDLGNDTLICVGDTIYLDASFPNSSYEWNVGSTDSILTVTQAWTYIVNVTNSFGTDSDTIVVSWIDIPQPDFGETQYVCFGDSLILNATSYEGNYLWNDNSTDPSLTVTQEGSYSVQVSNLCGFGADTVSVLYEDCTPEIVMPNVFTPDNDGLNDIFLPVVAEDLLDPSLVILNRWGNKMHETTDLQEGWNGTLNGKPCAEGVYFFIIHYTDDKGISKRSQGFFHLIR